VRLEPLAPDHAAGLFAAFDGHDANWAYLPYGPLDRAGWDGWVPWAAALPDTLFFALCDPADGTPRGVASYLRITPAHGVAEVGHLNFAPGLQASPAATEAMALMMARVFAAGYRRYEWKCNAANLASRRAAQRLGFSYEGTFRQHMVVKGANRDTAWFSVLDRDWQPLSQSFSDWLDPSNFDVYGRQIKALSAMTAPFLAARDPAI
jgi:RimJ/RimL family protein N-acetyltransferase